jgi:RNA polymerase sigma factor (TIGR02999 family)
VSDVTRILTAIDSGDTEAARSLLPLVYDELRQLAARRMAKEAAGHTLQATDLVHEAYLRLVGPDRDVDRRWDSRGHFFAAAAEAMRRILIDHARAKGAVKRGGALRKVQLDASRLTLGDVPVELLDLDESLGKLAQEDPAKAELVKLRFFGGLTLNDAARVLGISPATADRHWSYARAWLYHDITCRQEG